jgi:general secretion pathway protein M
MNELKLFWQARTTRERMTLLVGGGLLLVALLYAFVWQPISRERQKLHVALPELRAKAAQMKLDAQEIQRLKGATTAGAQNIRGAIEQSAQASGMRDKLTSTDVLDKSRARVTLSDVPFDQFLAWLDRLQQDGHVRLEAGQVEALPQTGHVKVQATFTLPGIGT